MPRPAAPLDADRLYERAVRALARRGLTEFELRRRLRPRATAPQALEAALERLRDHGYLDDARLAASAALYEKEVYHHGRLRALRDLRARGVGAELAADAVAAVYAARDGNAEENALVRAYARRKRLRRPETLHQAGTLYRKLLTAGFSPAACQRCLRAWKLEPEWLEQLMAIEITEETPNEPETA